MKLATSGSILQVVNFNEADCPLASLSLSLILRSSRGSSLLFLHVYVSIRNTISFFVTENMGANSCF